MDDVELLTTKEAAQFLKLHPDTVSRMAKAGKIPATKPFGEYRFKKAALLTWLDAHTTATPIGNSDDTDLPTPLPTDRPRLSVIHRDYAAEFNAVVGQAAPRKGQD